MYASRHAIHKRSFLQAADLERISAYVGFLFVCYSTPIAAKVRTLLGEMAGLAGVARSVGVDPAKVVIRSRRHGADPLPPDLQILRPTKAGLDEAAQRIEERSNTPPERMPPMFSGNTVSLAAYRTRLQPPTDAGREQGEDPDGT